MNRYPKMGLTCTIVLLTVLLAVPASVVNTSQNIELAERVRKNPSTNRAETLSCRIQLSNSILGSGETAQLNVIITKGQEPANNVTVELSCEAGIFDFENGTTNITGQVSVNFTAPILNITTDIRISIVANRTEPDKLTSNTTVKVLSQIDFLSPWVVSTSPEENSTNVSIETNIRLEFSESMNRSSVVSAISISPHFEYELIWHEKNLTIKPRSFLSYETAYRCNLLALCTDLYGNILGEYSTSFTTEGAPIPVQTFDVSIDHTRELAGGEYQIVTISVYNRSTPLANASITVLVLEGNISSAGGLTDKDGNFSFIYTAPMVSGLLSDKILINITKGAYEDFKTEIRVNVTPRVEHLISQILLMEDGTVVEGYGIANGTVVLRLEEGSNPTPLTTGFMDIFVNVSSHGQGELLWLNLSIRYLFIPKDRDKQDIAIHYLRSPTEPWLKCLRTGGIPAKNIVWANLSLENVDYPLTVAPRARSSTPKLKGSINGTVSDQTGNGLPNVLVGLYKSGVNVRSVKTGANGSFVIGELETGSYEIRVDEPGYKPFSMTDRTVIAGDNSIDINLELRPLAAISEETGDNGAYGIYIVFLIFFLVLIIIIIIKMYFIRTANKDRDNNGEGLKDSATEARFQFRTRPGSTRGDISKKQRRGNFEPMEYLPLGMTDRGEFECPVCGSGVSQDARTCPLCKANFVDDEFVCPDCGMPLSSKDRNCKMCGIIFGEAKSREWKSVNEKARRGSSGAIEDFFVEKEWDS